MKLAAASGAAASPPTGSMRSVVSPTRITDRAVTITRSTSAPSTSTPLTEFKSLTTVCVPTCTLACRRDTRWSETDTWAAESRPMKLTPAPSATRIPAFGPERTSTTARRVGIGTSRGSNSASSTSAPERSPESCKGRSGFRSRSTCSPGSLAFSVRDARPRRRAPHPASRAATSPTEADDSHVTTRSRASLPRSVSFSRTLIPACQPVGLAP